MSDASGFGPSDEVEEPEVVRPCLDCRAVVTFDGQPGDGTCPACGLRQYLTAPGPNWPEGGQGRSESGGRGLFG